MLVLTLTLACAAGATGRDETLLLEVVVNGFSTQKIGEFTYRDGVLLSRRQELTDLGFHVPPLAHAAAGGLIPLAELPRLVTRLDQATQTLYVTAPAAALLPELLRIAPPASRSTQPVESGIGTTLNYDITDYTIGGFNVATGTVDYRVFSPWGVLSTQALAHGYFGISAGHDSVVRLDSAYVYSDPASLRRYRLGDFISGGLAWTRPVRLTGVQVDSDFALRPDLVTSPLPSLTGTAAVPSTVDVLVNGTQLLSRQVQPGPFQIPQLPVVGGSGMITMTLTDASGRQTTTTLPFYAAGVLLAPGLQSYSLEAGRLRRNWGILSNDYGPLAASATYRRGLTSYLTVEGHAEGSPGQAMGGVGLVANLWDLGIVTASAAASSAGGHTGTQVSIGAQRLGRIFSLGGSLAFASQTFSDIAAQTGAPIAQRQVNLNASISLGRLGTLSAAYSGVDYAALPAPISFYAEPGSFIGPTYATGGVVSLQGGQHVHLVTASYSVGLGPASLSVTGFRDFASSNDAGALFEVTIPFGSRSWAGASAGSDSGGTYQQVQAGQSATSVGEWGYQVFAQNGTTPHEFAQLQYEAPVARLSAGVDRLGQEATVQAEAQGAVSFIDGGLFASNTINDSFAVVDTDGTKGVRVLSENRLVGRTDSAGRLLVPDLQSFQANKIAIDPADVPINASIAYVTKDVRPQDRSGVLVHFPVQFRHGALLRLVDEAGRPLPLGSTATLKKTGVAVPVGYEGEAYVEDLVAENTVIAERPDGRRCTVHFAFHAIHDDIPTIGPLHCKGEPR